MSEDGKILDSCVPTSAGWTNGSTALTPDSDELTTGISTLGRDLVALSLVVAELKVDFASMHSRFDTTERRLARIEPRLKPIELPAPSRCLTILSTAGYERQS